MDRYPDFKLRPTTEFPGHEKIKGFDYVQDLKKAFHGNFYLLVKDEKFGVYMYDSGFFFTTNSVALKAVYDSIEFISNKGQSFGAVVKKDEKYGMIFWTYGRISNNVYEVASEYDSIEKIDSGRFKAIKDNKVTYFDATGHVLK